jgi:hypothetical protein
MLIVNGQEVIEGAYLLDCAQEQKQVLKTDDYVVTRNDTGYTLVMSAGANSKTFTLFTPATADVGKRFTFANIGTGRLTIAVAGAGVSLNGGTAATGTMYSDTDTVATLTIEVMSATLWSVISATGTWSTT